MLLSIVYPVKSLKQDKLVNKCLKNYNFDDVEQIIVTSDKEDLEKVFAENVTIIIKGTNSRAIRLNHGIKNARGDMILLHHPRSLIERKGIEELLMKSNELVWGAFTHAFDTLGFLYKFTSFYSNKIRGDMRKVYYLDHCIFAKKRVLEEIGYVPELDIFEDTALCEKLKKIGSGERLHAISTTEAIRFEKNGFFRQAFLNMKLKFQYRRGKDHQMLNKEYEENLELNSEYE